MKNFEKKNFENEKNFDLEIFLSPKTEKFKKIFFGRKNYFSVLLRPKYDDLNVFWPKIGN